ncbi:MAG: hypothetical protein HGA45_04150 [Chloroflexales bacterium]|nr:hypothetical protein [Chloroflexales bacterium]
MQQYNRGWFMTVNGRGSLSLVIALFLLVSMLLGVNTLIMGGIAIIALVILAVWEFTARVGHPG